MKPFWNEMIALLQSLAYMVKRCDPDGIELYFMGDDRRVQSKDSTKLIDLAKKVKPSGTADPRSRLRQLVSKYETRMASKATEKTRKKLPQIRQWISGKPARGVNIYVMTAGVWRPGCDLAEMIKNLVAKIILYPTGHAPIGIQFIQFGDSEEGRKTLEHLDHGLDLPL
jgi:hypothetical protein